MIIDYLIPGITGQAKRFSHKIAVKSDRREVSYLELERRSNRLANFIHGKIKTVPHVGIIFDRSPEMIEAIIGLLKAGLVFVPLNPAFPANRIETMIEEIKAEWIITSIQYYEKFNDILIKGKAGAPLNVLIIDENKNSAVPDSNVFTLQPDLESTRLLFTREFSDHCYIYFTSGSTGTPKAVLGRQTGLAHFIQWEIKEFAVSDQVRASQFTPPTFDPYLRDIFLPLSVGGTSYIPPAEILLEPRAAVRWIDDNEISFMHTIPSLFKAMTQEIDNAACLKHVKYILLAGELLRGRDIHRFIEIFGDRIQLVNVYGPTETTLAKLFYRVKPADAKRSIIPVGKPIEGAQVLILDGKIQRCRIGKKGEIYIRTPFRSAGYYNDADLNEKLFIKNPYGTNTRDIIYKTGDLGCLLPDGNIELSGRVDFQVKIRGQRIETAEIENRLLQYGDVREVVVDAREEEKGDKYLCAYVVPVPGRKPTNRVLKEFLARELPDYMIPAYFVFLETIPLTPNGKVDRQALPQPGLMQEKDYIAPRNELEKKLVGIFARVLAGNPGHEERLRQSIGSDGNFFDLGGHSLKANTLRSGIFKEFGVQVPLAELFKTPTIKGLAQYIGTASPRKFTAIVPGEKKEYYALSPAQERLYVLHRFDTTSTAYHITNVLSLEGVVDKDKLTLCFKKLIARHESLRTAIIMLGEKAVQRIHPPHDIEFAISEYDIPEDRKQNTKRSPTQWGPRSLIDHFIHPFDLEKAPLLRVGLVQEDDAKYILMIDIHHIVTDGTSQVALVNDFASFYNGRELPPLRIMYKEYAAWQLTAESDENRRKQEEYWVQQFTGQIPIIDLPTDFPRPPVQSFAGARIDFKIDEAGTRSLNEIARANGVTLFMVSLAIFNIFLSKLSSQEEIVIGVPIAGRRHADLGRIIGMFVNTLALRNYPQADKMFTDLLMEIRERTLGAFENQDYSFESLVEKLDLQRDLNRNPLFDVMFVFQNLGEASEEISEQAAGSLVIKPYPYEHRTAKFDLTLIVYEREARLDFTFEYSTRLFKEETIARFIGYFKTIVSSTIENPGEKIAVLEILPDEEKQKLSAEFNDTAKSYPRDKTIYELFTDQVDKIPNKPALVFHDSAVTYSHFDETANRIAHYLRGEQAVEPGDRIVVLMDRSCELIMALMGVMKARCAYIPMDASLPPERIRVVVEDAYAGVIVSQRKYLDKLALIKQPGKTAPAILDMDDRRRSADKYPAHRPPTGRPHDPAYIMYTSGSSGVPKGVLVEHCTIVNTLVWRKNNYEYAPGDVSLQVPPYFFDSSVTDIFTPLIGGARLALTTEAERTDLTALRLIITRNKVTHFIAVPVFYNMLLEEIAHDLKNIKMICCAGENFPDELIRKHFEKLPQVRIFNEYGPTENSVNTTAYKLKPDSAKALIGKPTSNVCVYILDRYLRLVPIGVAGEMCLAGSSVARGYLNSPELTAEKFITSGGQGAFLKNRPLHPQKTFINSKSFCGGPGGGFLEKSPLISKLYKTGDMARWLADGNLEFLGRIDTQVKIHGIRIETGEVENLLLKHGDIKDAVVQVRQEKNGADYLCAYIVPHTGNRFSHGHDHLKEYLSGLLPAYMMPRYFLELERLPLTANGKLDINALPDPAVELAEEYTAPRSEIEKKMVEIWQAVLGKEDIGINDNFFHIGGDSIKSIQIMSRMSSAGYKLDMKDLFRFPAISELAPLVKKSKRIPEQRPVTGTIPLTPIQHIFFNAGHGAAHHYNQAVMFFSSQGFHKEAATAVFTRILERHDALRITFKIDPENGGVVQTNRGLDLTPHLQEYDLRNRENSRLELESLVNEIQAGIDLEKGPPMRLGLFHLDDGDRLLVVIHHLVVDGISWRILFEDIETLYSAYLRGEEPVMPPKTDSFKLWAERLQEYADSKRFLQEKAYWEQLESQAAAAIPHDFNESPDRAPDNFVKDSRSISFSLDKEETNRLLHNVNRAYNTEINDILATALAVAIKKSFGLEKAFIALEGHGREAILDEIDTSRTVGWFTSEYPVLLDVSYTHNPGRQVKEIKETLRKIPHKGIGYGILKYLTQPGFKEGIDFKLRPQIIFNYLGEFAVDARQISHFKIAKEPVGNNQGLENHRLYEIEINGMTARNRLAMTISYDSNYFKKATIAAFARCFESEIKSLIDHCAAKKIAERTPGDFTYKGLSIAGIDRITAQYPDVEDIYTLTPMQEGMLFYARLDETSDSYFEQFSYRLHGELDIALVEKSLNELFKRHDVLRTAFVYKDIERSVQVVLKNRRIDFYYQDIGNLADSREKEDFVRQFKAKDKERSFDLSKDVLMRVSILRLDNALYEFTWSSYHILMDGWCVGILNSEFFQVYSAYAAGRDYRLPPVKPYRDYIQWLEKQDKEASARYWADYLAAFAEQTGVPRPATAVTKDNRSEYRNRRLSIELDRAKATLLNKLAARRHVTLNTLARTLWGILLGKYNGKKDVVFGAVVSGRPYELAGVESMIGLFINTVPVRLCFEENIKFSELLRQAQEEALQAEPYHYYPLAEIQSASALKQDLIDHIFIFENYPAAEMLEASGAERDKNSHSSLTVTDIDVFEQTNYDFNILIADTESLRITFQYNENVYDSEYVNRIAGHYRQTFDQIIENEEAAIAEILFLSPREMQRILYEFNDTALEYPAEKAIHELFAEQAQRTPDYIAVTGTPLEITHQPVLQITYGEMYEKSSRLANGLTAKGVEHETIVAIVTGRYVEMLIGLLGILQAGGAYLPIDPGLPGERKRYILQESASRFLLTESSVQKDEVFIDPAGKLIEMLFLDSLLSHPGPGHNEIKQKLLWGSRGRFSRKEPPARIAYAIYTSGSTGKPKGVMIEHSNVVNFIFGTAADIRFLPHKTILAATNITFDIFVLETFLPLAKGLQIILADAGQQAEPGVLLDLLVKHNIQMAQLTPSRLRMLLVDKQNLDKFRSVEELMIGGEALPPDLFEDVKKGFAGKIYNMYGPTETTVWSTFKDLTQEDKITIGGPLANTQVYILDHFGSVQPEGMVGELCIAGDGLARGYLNRPELTLEKFASGGQGAFLKNRPLHPQKTFNIYKTGDLARWLPNGEIEFIGRIDFQIKIRGFRVELGEIETRLKEYPDIKEALVIDRTDKGRQYLCAYYTMPPEENKILQAHDLKEHLEGKLPAYMIPACFVKIDRIPLNPSGKIDRSKLPRPQDMDFHQGGAYQAPQTDVQQIIAEIWQEVLDREKVGVQDNFFDLGGNSIDFAQVGNKLKEKLGREIPIVKLFTYPTIASLERFLASEQGEENLADNTSYRPELVDEGTDFMLQTLRKLDAEDDDE